MKRLVLFGFIGAIALAGTAWRARSRFQPYKNRHRPTVGCRRAGAARNGADVGQLIGCDTYTDPTGSSTSCYAEDATGKTWVSCYTFDPNFREAVRSLKGDSFLQFQWDASGQCTLLEVKTRRATSRRNEPAAPEHLRRGAGGSGDLGPRDPARQPT